MDEEIFERPPHTRPVPVQEEDILDGSIRSRTPPPATKSSSHDMGNLTHIEKLLGDNFPVWKFQMCIFLRARKMLGIVNGTTPRESFTHEEDWFDRDAACQSFLISAIDSRLMHRLMNCRTANQMWRRLCTVHEQNATKNVQVLQQQFFDMRMKSDAAVVDHISCIEQLANQLNNLGETVSDQAVICKILSTLPPRFRHLLSAWDSVPRDEQTIESLTLRLLKEESRNKVQDFMENEEERAFFSSRGPTSNSGRRLLSAEEKRKHAAKITELKKKTKCRRCGKHGHWERECPNGKKGSDFDKPNEKTTRKGEAHAVITEDLDEGESSAFMVHVDECSDDDAWYMDGGATDHMTDRLDWFATFKPVSQGRWPVMIADNRRLWVRGVGRIQIQCEVNGSWYPRDIHHVLYVPELRKNLFSVGQADDKGFITTYTRRSCFLTSSEGRGKVVLTGTRVNKLYKLALIVNRPNTAAHIATSHDTNTRRSTTRQRDTPALQLTLWHQRFGHVNHAMLVHMHAHNTVQGMTLPQHTMPDTPCEGCAFGKSARQPFPKIRSSPRAEKPAFSFTRMYAAP